MQDSWAVDREKDRHTCKRSSIEQGSVSGRLSVGWISAGAINVDRSTRCKRRITTKGASVYHAQLEPLEMRVGYKEIHE